VQLVLYRRRHSLYSIITNRAAILALFRVTNRYVDARRVARLPRPGDPRCWQQARDGDDALGMPPPPRTPGAPVTNIRNTSSPHWRMLLKPENRCLVPANSFAEYAPEPNLETKMKDVVWFALNEDRPLFAFAGHLDRVQGRSGR
jgi:putative SOS response-associated peptidase YedK